jgi:hypothetical protein
MIFNKKGEANLFDFLFIVFFSFLFYFFVGGSLSSSAHASEDATLLLIKQNEAQQLFMTYLSAPLDNDGTRVLDLISGKDYDEWKKQTELFFSEIDFCLIINIPPEENPPEELAQARGNVQLPDKYLPHFFSYYPQNIGCAESFQYNNYKEFEINPVINRESKPITFQYVIKK